MQKLTSVLLVDDDETTNFLNTRLLQSLGVTDTVLVARNGQEALALLAQHCAVPANCPPLILLDLNMPVMGGIGFLEAYHPQPPAPPLCVVVLTTSAHPDDLARLQALSPGGLLHKPLTRSKVEALLREHFHRHLPARTPAQELS